MERDSSHFLVVQHKYLKEQQHNFHTNISPYIENKATWTRGYM